MLQKANKMYKEVIKILGIGIARHTEISIFNNQLVCLTDTEIDVERLKQLDKLFGSIGYVKVTSDEDRTHIVYHLPE